MWKDEVIIIAEVKEGKLSITIELLNVRKKKAAYPTKPVDPPPFQTETIFPGITSPIATLLYLCVFSQGNSPTVLPFPCPAMSRTCLAFPSIDRALRRYFLLLLVQTYASISVQLTDRSYPVVSGTQ